MTFNLENNGINECINGVEVAYRGLGVPVTYGILSILANKSVFFIGGRGVGKTRLIRSVPQIENHAETTFDTFTYGELDTLCHSFEPTLPNPNAIPQVGVRDEKLVFKVPEFSTLSEYHREVFLTVCSRVASDGDYFHQTTMTPHLRFENCKLAMLIAIQPRLYSQLCNRYQQWESMSSDRFTKFLLLNPLRQGATIDEPFVATLPREIPPTATLPTGLDLTNIANLFAGQVSEGRKLLYARDYAIAMARLQGRTEVIQEDIDVFYQMFKPYLDSFTKLQERFDLEASVTVCSGNIELLVEIAKHIEGVTEEELATALMVTPRHIERGLGFLLEKELIRQLDRHYCLNQELTEYFTLFRNTFSLDNVAGE